MSHAYLRALLHDTTDPARLVPALSSGFIVGLLIIVVQLSLASLIFSGPLSAFAPMAAGLTLFGAAMRRRFIAPQTAQLFDCAPLGQAASLVRPWQNGVAFRHRGGITALTDCTLAFLSVATLSRLQAEATAMAFYTLLAAQLESQLAKPAVL